MKIANNEYLKNKVYEINNESALDLAVFLQSGIAGLNLVIPKIAQEKIVTYVTLLYKWNQVHNLIASCDLKTILIRHIFDSLAVTPFIIGPDILDFGTGAGFPGIPLALALPQWNFVLLDSSNKKTTFLNHVVFSLGIKNVKIVAERIEKFRFEPGFATIVTRATTTTDVIFDKTKRLGIPNGQILIMKGKHYAKELKGVTRSLKVQQLKVPYLDEERYILCIK